jgi:hypothetical protein
MAEDAPPRRRTFTARRALVAVLIGLGCALLIWIVTPYNDMVLANMPLSDNYLPASALLLTVLLVLLVNPLLRLVAPGKSLTGPQLAIILGIMLVACAVPGLLSSWVHMLATPPRGASRSRPLAEHYDKMNLPRSLFPDRVEYETTTPASDAIADKLPPGETIRWPAWRGPAISWGALLVSVWLMMIGMATIVVHQWRKNERLRFPLLSIQQSLIEEPEEGRLLPALFRSPGFWTAAVIVLALHLLLGAKQYWPGSIPAIPLSWNFNSAIRAEPWNQLPGILKMGQIFFVFVGVAFFMQTRIAFSIWFFIVAYGVYQMICASYLPPFSKETMTDQRIGAMVSIAAFVLWFGRHHWWRVIKGLVRRATTPDARRDRVAGWMFVVGCAGMGGWLLWVGLDPWWSLALVAYGLTSTLLLTRFVAETGTPFFRMYLYPTQPSVMLGVFPIGWLDRVSIWLFGVFSILFLRGSRTSAAAMATHAQALDEQRSPQGETRMAWLLLGVLVAGLLVCGSMHVWVGNHFAISKDGRVAPMNAFELGRFSDTHRALDSYERGALSQPNYNRGAHITFGVVLGAVLYLLCLRLPWWPLHPMGIMTVYTYYGNTIWPSIFVGWLAKVLIVRFGGAKAYRGAQKVFIGLIVGELLAVTIWTVVPMILAALGEQYEVIQLIR